MRALLAVLLLASAACSTRPGTQRVAGSAGEGGSAGGGGGGAGGMAGTGGDAGGGSGGCADCVCTPGDRRWCQREDTDDRQRHVGACRDGSQLCEDGRGWGPCGGGVGPAEEPLTCDGIDQDCDGLIDGPPALPCRWCGTGLEVCGNAVDDDCDGFVDPARSCGLTCRGVEPGDDAMACCWQDPEGRPAERPVPHSWRCVESPDLPACSAEARLCLDLDDDPGTQCTKRCTGDGCFCGEPAAGTPAQTPTCGFETPCAHLGCEERTGQPCYSGFVWNLGVGICRGGVTSCEAGEDGLSRWGACEGEQLPLPEVCGNLVDDDCDGLIDEEEGHTHARCEPGCTAAFETCNGLDDDCDGFVDESCAASGMQKCYAGPPGTRGVGACRDGIQLALGRWWSTCTSVGPGPEACGDGIDSDCNGRGGPGEPEDPGCCVASGPEVCNEVDDDCDGLIDEGVVNACGTCGGECYSTEFQDPAWCQDGNRRNEHCYNVVPHNPGWFTISTDRRGTVPWLWPRIALPQEGELAALGYGQKVWQVNAHVEHPRHVGVPRAFWDTWVGGSALVHLDRDQNVVCRVDLGASVAGLAIAPFGEVWAVDATGGLHEVSGWGVGAPDEGGYPTCDTFDLAPGDPGTRSIALGVRPRGLAISGDEILWTASSPAARVDARTLAWELVEHLPSDSVAVDREGNAWFGGPAVHVVSARGPYTDPAEYQRSSGAQATSLALDLEGLVWGAQDAAVVRLDPATLAPTIFEVPGPIGSLTVDVNGDVWAIGTHGVAHVQNPWSATGWDTFDIDPGKETAVRGDFTGAGLYRYDTRIGSWTRSFDAGYPTTRWRRIDWQQHVPFGARIEVSARFAATREGLETSTHVCGPFTQPPADLGGCPQAVASRWIAVTFRMWGEGQSPVAGEVELSWTRP